MRKQLAVIFCILTFTLTPVAQAVSSKEAQYDGGTVNQIPKSQTGTIAFGNDGLNFQWKNSFYAIPYASISDMEYGNKPSTRIGTAIGVSLICWPCGIASLFVKSHHHFLTLEFNDGTVRQAVIFELGKRLPDEMLPVLEAKTGKKVTRQAKE